MASHLGEILLPNTQIRFRFNKKYIVNLKLLIVQIPLKQNCCLRIYQQLNLMNLRQIYKLEILKLINLLK